MKYRTISFLVIVSIIIASAPVYAANGDVKWTFQVANELGLSAVGPDGTIYVGDTDGSLYALNPANGIQYWSFQITGEVGNGLAIGSDGTIYVGSGDNKLYAVNPDGTEKWSFNSDSAVRPPAIGSDGTIYIGSNEILYAINPDGTEKWSVQALGFQFTFISIGSNGTLYAGTLNYQGNGGVFAICPSGYQEWFFSTGDLVFAPAIGQDGTIYAGSSTRLYAINPDGSMQRFMPLKQVPED